MSLFNNNGRKEEKVRALLTKWREVSDERAMQTRRLRGQLEDVSIGYRLQLAQLESEIKKLVVSLGTPIVVAGCARATYRRGYTRTSWNGKALKGYAAAHPEILEFKKETQIKPSVSIKMV